MANYYVVYSNTLSHHGVKGMKWGVRRDKLKRKWKNYRAKRKKARSIQRELHRTKYKLEEKANKKYDVDYKEKMARSEKEYQDNFRQLGLKVNEDWHPAQDRYDETIKKRDKEISKKLIKQYGQEKYDTMVQEDMRDDIIAVVAILGIVGAVSIAEARKK